ncbi:MAG: T9SS type A sorting domain-containing protein [Flavobacteriales bacterium]
MLKKVLSTVSTILFLTFHLLSQDFYSRLEQPLPQGIANNAVSGGMLNGIPHVFSFTGIDSRKNYTGIGLKAFRYNTQTQIWDTIPDLPDTRGKIAAGASTIDSIIYIIGGYHVDRRGNEVSSNKVHRYNINTNSYLTNGADIPVPIDDHVQAVWRDSLIFVVTGWSNSGNVPNVQIYNPANNIWTSGTPTPNTNNFKSFGASGAIKGNSIYYFGGASGASGFDCQNRLRVGEIDPLNPTSISWSDSVLNPNLYCYRAACVSTPAGINWLGGSSITYNYNGIAYNGSGGVSTTNQNIYYNPQDSTISKKYIYGDSLPMDIRGIADFGNTKYIVGGMTNPQQVTNKVWKLDFELVGINENKSDLNFSIFPNPSIDYVTILNSTKDNYIISIYSISGKLIKSLNTSAHKILLNVQELHKGIYLFKISSKNKIITKKITIL